MQMLVRPWKLFSGVDGKLLMLLGTLAISASLMHTLHVHCVFTWKQITTVLELLESIQLEIEGN